MKNIIKNTLNAVADFLFPSHCFYCSRTVTDGAVICRDCYKEIEKITENVCDKCGRAVGGCDCKRFVYHFSGVTAPFKNEGIAKTGLYSLKFAGNTACVDFYAYHMVKRLISREEDNVFNVITYVPMSPLRRARRGYNQAELLAKAVGKRLNLKVRGDLLRRTVFSKTQHKKVNVAERFENAYKSYRRTGKRIHGRVLLIDDIKTSGASLEACSRELMYAGADEVFCLTALLSDKNS